MERIADLLKHVRECGSGRKAMSEMARWRSTRPVERECRRKERKQSHPALHQACGSPVAGGVRHGALSCSGDP